jgi:subfamily B ATP-binding cassette protein HlyB/CyaB
MQNDGFTVGMLVAFQMFASRMSQPMLRLVGLWQEFQQANIAVKRLGDILDMPQEPHALTPQREQAGQGQLASTTWPSATANNSPGSTATSTCLQARPPDRDHGPLRLRQEHAGQTDARLLPTAGRADRLDGKDIRYLAANELRSVFGVVPQETVLFSGTLYDNLVMAHPHASFEDVIAACKAAEIHEVIEKLPDGYQTEIGERGTGLSGGQTAADRHRPGATQATEDPDLRRGGLQPRSADGRTLRQDDQQAQGEGDDDLFITHQIPRGLQVDEVFGPVVKYRICKPHACESERLVFIYKPATQQGWGKIRIDSEVLGDRAGKSIERFVTKQLDEVK